MQKFILSSMQFLAIGFTLSAAGNNAYALSVYVPFLDTVISNDEPCFYAKNAGDVHGGKDRTEFPKIMRTKITIDDMDISVRSNGRLQNNAGDCVQLSHLLPAKITQFLEFGVIYYISLDTSYDGDWKAWEQERQANSVSNKNGLMQPTPLPPISHEFRGAFCILKNGDGTTETVETTNPGCRIPNQVQAKPQP